MKTISKAIKILDKEHKNKVTILFFFSLVASFLELLGIGIILPFLSSLVSEEVVLIDKFKFIGIFLSKNEIDIKVFFLLLIFAVFLTKNTYLYFQLRYQSKIIFLIAEKLSSKLFKIYLNLNIIDFKLRNTSTLIRNTTAEINTFCSGFVNSFINILTETILLSAIITFLMFIDYKLTLVSLLFLIGFSLIIYFSLRKKIHYLGKLRQSNEAGRLQYLNQGFGAIKDIKLSSNENKFLNDFNLRNQNCLKSTRDYFVFSNLPRLLLELAGIVVFIIIFYLLIKNSSDTSSILPRAGLFFVAFFRMMPSANKILISFQSLNFARVSIDLLKKELEMNKNAEEKIKNLNKKNVYIKNKIVLENINFKYSEDQENYNLSNINFEIKKGEVVGISGPSGAGKSTLIDLILGFYEPNLGKILLDDENIHQNISDWQNIIGYVPQSIFLIDSSIKNNIILSDNSEKINDDRLKYAIEKSQLNTFINNLEYKMDTLVGERGARISGGQLQRIGIARALYKNSQILIFDEATNALDKRTQKSILETIYQLKENHTSIIVSHDKDCLQICDKIINLDKGKIIS